MCKTQQQSNLIGDKWKKINISKKIVTKDVIKMLQCGIWVRSMIMVVYEYLLSVISRKRSKYLSSVVTDISSKDQTILHWNLGKD